MEYWEFLVQKEGDRSWQPIKSPKIELAAGRYRVVVHSNRISTDVEICVTHTSTDEMPPKRRSQKRSRRTNKEGLMVVIPFTFLKPGLWEFRCCGDVMSDFLGNSWQEVLQLYVLPKVTAIEAIEAPSVSGGAVDKEVRDGRLEVEGNGQKAEEVLSPTISNLSPATSNVLTKKTVPPSRINPPSLEPALSSNPILEKSLQMLEQVLQEVLDPIIQEFDRPTYEEARGKGQQVTEEAQNISHPASDISPLTSIETTWQGIILSLDEDALVVKPEASLTIRGKVDLPDANQLENGNGGNGNNDLFQGILSYELRHPQTAQVILEAQKSLSQEKLPLKFSHELEIPPDYNSCLLLGKVTLYGLGGILLAVQPFTVTADLDKLLGAIQLDSEEVTEGNKNVPVYPISTSQALAGTIPLLNQNLLNLVNFPHSHQPLVFSASSGQLLPPQLSPGNPPQRSQKSLDLPTFSKAEPSVVNGEEKEGRIEEANQGNLPLTESLSTDDNESIYRDLIQEDIITEVPINFELTHVEIAHNKEESAPELPATVVRLQDYKQQKNIENGDNLSLANSRLTGLVDNQIFPVIDNGKEELESRSAFGANEARSKIEEEEESILLNQEYISQTEEKVNIENEEPLRESSEEIPFDTVGDEITSIPVSRTAMSDPLLLGPEPVKNDPIEVDRAFQSLNLETRFWSRINDLMGDTELSEALKFDLLVSNNLSETQEQVTPIINSEPLADGEEEEVTLPLDSDSLADWEEEVTPPLNSESGGEGDFDESIWDEETEEFSPHTDEIETPTQEDIIPVKTKIPDRRSLAELASIDWAAQEIVIEDESLSSGEAAQVEGNGSRKIKSGKRLSSQPKTEPVSQIESDSPLPAPKLLIPTHELVSGEPVLVRVQVPCDSARLGVKLWIQDRQSRTLLDGPRWLMDLLPNGVEELEGITQLIVPFGTVEIRFEAISIDLDSDRESHKISIDCVVVPPDLPQLSFDDF
ncbi:hypothetical protein [Limnofasciculus baicalensis]|uniref:Uncharacterized protein n=1 Tax=Limnofasciculus baicalensis BBK-W-15 TaxID=2699891 RepID=A0AAE3KQA1_9CYAN|nr:hypothetical protein [Limnofasciculus baicalensis]MCP2732239.1 hypothetical protein [Limnofasciculus baicalensis BBK-W-15]